MSAGNGGGVGERTPEFVFSDEMVERAVRALDRAYDRTDLALEEVARDVLTAAFSDVPATNYGIGLALQFFDLVICVKDGKFAPRAGVYRATGPDSFDSLGHSLQVGWGHEPARYLKSVAVHKLDPPAADADEAAA